MTGKNNRPADKEKGSVEEDEKIAKGFEQMEFLHKSRCIQAPPRSNVTVKEITSD